MYGYGGLARYYANKGHVTCPECEGKGFSESGGGFVSECARCRGAGAIDPKTYPLGVFEAVVGLAMAALLMGIALVVQYVMR